MKRIFDFCRPYLKKYRGLLILLIALYITVSLASIAAPYITRDMINDIESNGAGAKILNYVLAIAILAVFELIVNFICERLYLLIQMKSGYALNADAIRHVQNIRFGYSENQNTAFLNQQINNDANLSVIFCITVLQNIIGSVLTLLIPLIAIFSLEPWLGFAMIGLNFVYFVLYTVLKKPVYKANYAFMDEQARFFSKLDSQLCSVKFIQSQGIANGFIARLDRSFRLLMGKAGKSQFTEYGFSGSDVVIKTAGTVLVFILGGAAYIKGKLRAGDLMLIMSYFAMSLGATQYFFGLGKQIQSTRVSCDRLQKIFDVDEQTNGSIVPDDINSIECTGLTFAYDADEPVFSGLELCFKKGGMYAFVGDNGSGKSTLINLLLGLFIDEYDGSVTYDGVPIEQLDMRTVRRKLVGISEQEPMLLEETLLFNLTLDEGKELDGALFGELCSVLHLDEYLASLPKGLDTEINESSSNLSGGEKQKISILRALLKKPKLLVLDEPTSAMDKESRESLIAYLADRGKDMIVLMSTHDPELFAICDEVIRLGQ